MSIHVFYYTGPYTRTLLPSADALLSRLSPSRRARFERRFDGTQRALDLAALRLLEIAMAMRGHAAFLLADVVYPQAGGASGKPVWRSGVDFSVSHARSLVACAISTECRVGIDVEERRALDPRIVSRILNEQASLVQGLNEGIAVDRWTQVEAVLKGAGLGVTHGRELDWRKESIALHGKSWWLHAFDCGSEHVGHVAVDLANAAITTTRVDEL